MLTTRKLISLMLALTVLMTAAVVPISAADNQTAPTGSGSVIYFDANNTGWHDVSAVQFYIHNLTTYEEFFPWVSKKLNGTDENGDNIWEYDPAAHGMDIKTGEQYGIIFVNKDTMEQTFDLIFDTTCYGDTAYCTGKTLDNPADDSKTTKEARWQSGLFGPRLYITWTGNVIGETCPAGKTPFDLLKDYLTDYYPEAVTAVSANEQSFLDKIGSGLGLSVNDVERAIEETDAFTGWRFEKSTLPADSSASPYSVSGIAEGIDVKPAVPDDMIYFDANSAGWKGVKSLKFYIYDGGSENKRLLNASSPDGADKNGDNIWEYALSDHGVEPDWNTSYDVIIENPATGQRTFDLFFNSPMFHDTAVCTGDHAILNSEGSYDCLVVGWKDHKDHEDYYLSSYVDLSGYWNGYNSAYNFRFFQYLTSPNGLPDVMERTGLSAQVLIDRLGTNKRNGYVMANTRRMRALLEVAATEGKDWNQYWNEEDSSLPGDDWDSSPITDYGWYSDYKKPDSDIHLSLEPISIPGVQELPAPRYKTIKGNRGEYKFYNLLPGTYKLTIKKRFNTTREYIFEVGKTADYSTEKSLNMQPVGDINGSGDVTTADYGMANSHARGKRFLTDYALKCADVVGNDGLVTTADAGRINSHARNKRSLWQ